MKPCILIIEDDDILRVTLRDNLEAQGWQVRAEADGLAGLDAAESWHADLILLDIMLPGANGYEICRSLRLEGSEIPILMITARGQTEDVVRGLELGADDYIVKPFALAELIARVRRFLKTTATPERRISLGGGLVLDTSAHNVNGLSELLTPKEYGVLELLCLSDGRALTRSQILQKVWGPGLFVTERSVDRAVKSIRAKLGAVGQTIQTVRGVGYRWNGSSD